jgi:hypothetical protein
MAWIERQVPKVLEAVEGFMLFMEGLRYAPPKAVGTAGVREIRKSESEDYETIVLNLPIQDEGDRSPYIRKVPKGWFNERTVCAEVIVREYKSSSMFSRKEPIVLDEGDYCLVAVRPLRQNTYRSPVDVNDPRFEEMFNTNVKGPKYCQGFYRRFMETS